MCRSPRPRRFATRCRISRPRTCGSRPAGASSMCRSFHAFPVAVASARGRRGLRRLARGDDLGDVAARLAPLHPRHNTSPANCSSTWSPTRSTVSARSANRQSSSSASATRFPPRRDRPHQGATRHKSKFALRAAAMLHGGVDV
jgi:hypothetical protein